MQERRNSIANALELRPSLQWWHNGRNGVSNHQSLDYLLNRLYRRRSKKTSRLRVTGLWERNSPVTGESPAQRASNAENVFIWWRHHACANPSTCPGKVGNPFVSVQLTGSCCHSHTIHMMMLKRPLLHNWCLAILFLSVWIYTRKMIKMNNS